MESDLHLEGHDVSGPDLSGFKIGRREIQLEERENLFYQ